MGHRRNSSRAGRRKALPAQPDFPRSQKYVPSLWRETVDRSPRQTAYLEIELGGRVERCEAGKGEDG